MFNEWLNTVQNTDCLQGLKQLPDNSIDCIITSPPYYNLRSYNVDGQIGLEKTPIDYLGKLWKVFDEAKRVLKSEGTCFVNLGDTYNGNKNGKTDKKVSNYVKDKCDDIQKTIWGNVRSKSLLQIPSRFSIGMCDRGWILRNIIVWHKKNVMPSSILDRCSNKYEQIFFFVKSKKYYFDLDSIRIPFETDEKRPSGPERMREKGYNSKFGTLRRDMENQSKRFGIRRVPQNEGEYQRNPLGKNPGDVWTLVSEPSNERHIAMFPTKLITPMILAGCPKEGIVLDMFMGAGTTARVAKNLKRNFIGFELNPQYIEICNKKLAQEVLF